MEWLLCCFREIQLINPQNLLRRIAEVNPERLEAYYRMLDRIILYSLAAHIIPPDAIDTILGIADKVVKKTIDTDSNRQNTFLHENKSGRQARLASQLADHKYDGEAIRLEYLKTWELVKEIAKANLMGPHNPSDQD